MFRKKGSMSIVIVVWMIVVMCCSALLNSIIYSRYVENQHYSRQRNKYMADGSAELCKGLLVGYFNSLSDEEYYTFTYQRQTDDTNVLEIRYANTDADGNVEAGSVTGGAVEHDAKLRIVPDNSPYIVRDMENDSSEIDIINESVNAYLANIGYLDFRSGENKATLSFDLSSKERYNLYNIVYNSEYAETWLSEPDATYIELPEMKAHVNIDYLGGHISTDLIISGLRLYRDKLTWVEDEGTVYAFIDTESMKIVYDDYTSIHVQ